jgi:hypothetical protein
MRSYCGDGAEARQTCSLAAIGVGTRFRAYDFNPSGDGDIRSV